MEEWAGPRSLHRSRGRAFRVCPRFWWPASHVESPPDSVFMELSPYVPTSLFLQR